MAEADIEEIEALKAEFEWILQEGGEHCVAAAAGYHAGMLQALSTLICRPRKSCEDRQIDSEQYKLHIYP
ncbi:hypothetical protein MTO96_002855 [Rhipicephalus appendiculatus]